MAQDGQQSQQQQFLSGFIAEIIRSPVNLALVGVIAILVYKIVKSRTKTEAPVQEVKKLPKLRRDFTIEELTKYDGKGSDGRILVAVNGSVYDVTRGTKFYGPGKYRTLTIDRWFFIRCFSENRSRSLRAIQPEFGSLLRARVLFFLPLSPVHFISCFLLACDQSGVRDDITHHARKNKIAKVVRLLRRIIDAPSATPMMMVAAAAVVAARTIVIYHYP